MRLIIRWVIVALVAGALIIQVVPYGRDHANPPVLAEPTWDSPQTRELAVRACYDCHSNETDWRWYSNIAPLSWYIQKEVDEGREHLNFSEWDLTQEEASEAAQTVRDGEMPTPAYRMTRSRGRLTNAEEIALIQGLVATLGDKEGGRDGDDDD